MTDQSLNQSINCVVTEPTIDFSNYLNKDLESSLCSINRDRFEHNYQACLAEINRRKTDGTWDARNEQEGRESILIARKWARIFALVQAVGGVIGVGNFIYVYGPNFFSGGPNISAVLVLIVIAVFTMTTWAGWKYWRTEIDTVTWRILLCLQIPGLQFSKFSYQFYSGFQIPVGFIEGQFKVSADLASNMVIVWSPKSMDFAFVVNLVPVIVLGLLKVARRQKLNVVIKPSPQSNE